MLNNDRLVAVDCARPGIPPITRAEMNVRPCSLGHKTLCRLIIEIRNRVRTLADEENLEPAWAFAHEEQIAKQAGVDSRLHDGKRDAQVIKPIGRPLITGRQKADVARSGAQFTVEGIDAALTRFIARTDTSAWRAAVDALPVVATRLFSGAKEAIAAVVIMLAHDGARLLRDLGLRHDADSGIS